MSDIDIEEHDLLDNPAIREIFPDLSVLKQELNNSFNQDDEAPVLPEFTSRTTEDHDDDRDDDHLTDNKEFKKELGSVTEHPFHRNKIILGSKPPKKLDYEDFFEKEIKLKGGHVQLEDLGPYLKKSDRYCGRCLTLFPNISVYENHRNFIHQQPSHSELLNEPDSYAPVAVKPSAMTHNRMVIGSNPTTKMSLKRSVNDAHPKRKIKASFTLGNKRFRCKLCKKTFYNEANVQRHLRNIQCSKLKTKEIKPHVIDEQTTMNEVERVEKSNEKNKHTSATSKMCSHCDCMFPNQDALIEHMYSILDSHNTSAKSTSTKRMTSMITCNYKNVVNSTSQISHKAMKYQISPSKIKTGVHIKKRMSPKISSESKGVSKKSSSKSEKRNIFFHRCPVCTIYFYNVDKCLIHLKRFHKVKLTRESLEQVPFQKQCSFCSVSYKNRKSFGEHIRRNHKKQLHSTGMPSNTNKKLLINLTRLSSQNIVMSNDSRKKLTLKETSKSVVLSNPRLHVTQKKHAVSVPLESSYREYPNVLTEDVPIIKSQQYFEDQDAAIQSSTDDFHGLSPPQTISEKDDAEDLALDCNENLPPSFILKSTLFKCNRCDIHFVSAKTAMSHLDHMELLVNWKCLKCHRIFKKEDQESHEKQHMISNNHIVHDFHLYGTSVLSKVLFKCVKCAVHFNEDKFFNHFQRCGKQQVDSVYCKWCDILIDDTISKFHESCHEQDNMQLQDLTIVEADILTDTDTSDKMSLALKRTMASDTSNNQTQSKITLGTKRKYTSINRLKATPGKKIKTNTDISNDELTNKVTSVTKINTTENINARLSNKEIVNTKGKTAQVHRLSSKVTLGTNKSTGTKKILNKETNSKKIETTDTNNDRFPRKRALVDRKIEHSSRKLSVRTKLLDSLLNMCYCDTCKCFIVECHKRDVHMEARCSHMVKYVCKYCGLVLTAKSYQTHKNLHFTKGNLKLHDFNFFDMRSGEKICPPIPHYPMCKNCEVHFASKLTSRVHECINDIYLTCHICSIKLSEEAFKLHMPFHKLHDFSLHASSADLETESGNAQCSAVDNEIVESNTNKETQNDVIEKVSSSNTNHMDIFYNTTRNEAQMENMMASSVTENNNKETISLSLNNETHVSSTNDNMLCENEEIIGTNIPYTLNCSVKIEETNPDELESVPGNDLLLFSCKSCKIAMNTYDKVVEHCQWHYSRQENQIKMSKCNICDITFENSSYNDHEKSHGQHHNNIFQILYFDTCYFKSSNDVWIKHLFGSLPKKDTDKIIGKSIYAFECRMKMNVIQHGEPDLTMYKCDKCQCYIDGSALYRHAENSCFKLRKHLCSFCGLAFMASIPRMQHEKIHENREITKESYRIVVFNRDEDKDFNNTLNSQTKYVLYQCRNCEGVICDKSLIKLHTCDKHDLVKCLKCGLLLCKSDYESHTLKHEDLPDFEVKNMKVILTGAKVNQSEQSFGRAQFKGMMKDYTFYSCKRCQICFQTLRMVSEHICCFGNNRSKCPDCELYFYSSRIKTHRKLHEIDADFIKQHMQIIPLDPHVTDSKSKTEDRGKSEASKNEIDKNKNDDVPSTSCLIKLTDRTKILQNPNTLNELGSELMTPQGSSEKNVPEIDQPSPTEQIQTGDLHPVIERITSIHKCYCGLHFLDKRSVLSHMKVCNLRMRATRQKCSKCGLTFTPNILYSHLLRHHGNKEVVYKFDVVEPTTIIEDSDESTNNIHISKSNIRDINKTIYKCKECSIHYLSEKSLLLHISKKNEHFIKHQDICNVCGLNFISATLAQHILNHHERIRIEPHEFIIKEY